MTAATMRNLSLVCAWEVVCDERCFEPLGPCARRWLVWIASTAWPVERWDPDWNRTRRRGKGDFRRRRVGEKRIDRRHPPVASGERWQVLGHWTARGHLFDRGVSPDLFQKPADGGHHCRRGYRQCQ